MYTIHGSEKDDLYLLTVFKNDGEHYSLTLDKTTTNLYCATVTNKGITFMLIAHKNAPDETRVLIYDHDKGMEVFNPPFNGRQVALKALNDGEVQFQCDTLTATMSANGVIDYGGANIVVSDHSGRVECIEL